MSSDLTNSKLAELAKSLSGKECALLVVGYYQQEEKDGKDYREEIKTIAACISPYGDDRKRKEYIFYYELWFNLRMFELDLQTCMLDLQCMDRQLQGIALALIHEAVNYHNLLLFRWTPKIFTEKQFEDLYNKERATRLAEVLPLTEAARYEAFFRLRKAGYFPKGSYLDKVDEDDNKWKLAVVEELTRLKTAVKNGKLKQAKVSSDFGWYHNGKVYIGQDGIVAQSWYSYHEKLDKDFNAHIDNQGELVEWENGRYAVAKEGTLLSKINKSNLPDGEDHRVQFEKRLENILMIKEENLVLDFEQDDYKQLIFLRLKDAQEWIQRLINHIEVTIKIENEIFGKEVSSNNLQDKAKNIIAQTVEGQNESIPDLLSGYNILRKEAKNLYTFKDENRYKLSGDLKPEEEWIRETIGKLVEISNKESGYNYEWT